MIVEHVGPLDGYRYLVVVDEDICYVQLDERYLWCSEQNMKFSCTTVWDKGEYQFHFKTYEDAFAFSVRWVIARKPAVKL